MISVIMSTFRRPELLKRAIRSVLNQTYTDFELIVVDDHSKDGTKRAVESFNDPRIRYIEREKNFGCDTQPKNDGIKASKGEYVCFLDDDNEYRPDHLAILHKEMTKENPTTFINRQHTNPDVVYGDRWLVCDSPKDDPNWIPSQIGIASDFKPELLMQRNFIDTSDALIKREALFDVGGFDERFKKYIDWNLWVRMNKYGKRFKRVPMIITDYHLHQDMKSLRVKTKHDTETLFAPEWDPYDCEIELPFLGKEIKPPRVAVFSITYDRLNYTKQSFESLRETAGYQYDHFVVDNGSTDGTQAWLKKHIDKDKLILNDKNCGISKASNQAIEMIKAKGYDCVLKWDNDCIGLTKGFLGKMVDIWKSNHKFALSCYVQGLVDNPGGAQRLGYGQIKGEMVGITKHIGGICHFVDAHAYDDFRWDEESFLHGVQDMEMSQYLNFHAFSQGYLENYMVSHGPEGTAKQKIDYKDYFERRVKEKQTRYAPDK